MNKVLNVVAGAFVFSTLFATTVLILDIDFPKNTKLWNKFK